jgi:tetratricopeptide (TPR) repeat protein
MRLTCLIGGLLLASGLTGIPEVARAQPGAPWKAWHAEGDAYHRAGDWNKALDSYMKVFDHKLAPATDKSKAALAIADVYHTLFKRNAAKTDLLSKMKKWYEVAQKVGDKEVKARVDLKLAGLHLDEGDAFRRAGDWDKAIESYTKAFDHKNTSAADKGKAALACANLYHTLFKGAAVKPDLLPSAKKWYDAALKVGDKGTRARAGNNLAVLRLDERNTGLYSPKDAADLFRKHVFPKGALPDVPDLFAYHYNFGRALTLTGEPEPAREEYWKAFKLQPQFAPAVGALATALAASRWPGRFTQGADLMDRVLQQRQPELARRSLYELLKGWGDDKEVAAVVPSLLRVFAATAVDAKRYRTVEAKTIAELRKRSQLTGFFDELDRVFLPDYFKGFTSQQNFLPLRRQAFLEHLPSWRRVLEDGRAPEAHYRDLARVLTSAGDSFRLEGRGKKQPEVRTEAFKQAAVRYAGAIAVAPAHVSAAVSLVTLLEEQAKAIDPKAKLFDRTVQALFDPKGTPVRAEDPEGRRALLALHLILTDRLARDGKWGPERSPQSALFQLQRAMEVAEAIRKDDKQFRIPPRLDMGLARAYEGDKRPEAAVSSYLRAAGRWLEARENDQATAAVIRARDLIARGAKATDAEKRQVESLLSRLRPRVEVAATDEKAPVQSVAFAGRGPDLVFLTDKVVKNLQGDGKITRVFAEGVSAMELTRDSRLLLCARGQAVVVMAFPSGKHITELRQEQPVVSCAAAPGGKLLATRDRKGALTVWDLQKNRVLARQELPPAPGGIAWAPGGRILAAVVEDKALFFVLGKESLQPLGTADKVKAEAPITALAFGPDGFFTTGDRNGKVITWGLDTGRPLLTLKGKRGAVSALAYSPDGELLAAGDASGQITVWNASSGQVRHTFTAELSEVNSLRFSADGRSLAAGGRSGERNGRVVTYRLAPARD